MLSAILIIAAAVFTAELGDKTQLLIIGLASKEKVSDIIIGTSVATIILNAMGVYLGVMISGFVRMEMIDLAAGFFFLVFAYLSLCGDDKAENVKKVSGIAAVSIGAMFFTAELGDKTQLAAMAFAASNPDMKLGVFLGATIGMFLADGAGLVAGVLLGKKLPQNVFSYLAFAVFLVFGAVSIYRSVSVLAPDMAVKTVAGVMTAYLAIVAVSLAARHESAKKHGQL